MPPLSRMKRRSIKSFSPNDILGYHRRDKGTGRAHKHLRCILPCLSRLHVSQRQAIRPRFGLPFGVLDLRIGDDVCAEAVFICEALPVGKEVRLWDVAIAPVRIEVRRERIPVRRYVRSAALENEKISEYSLQH